MVEFVHKDSVVRKIWGKSDTILFIFAGAAAEFALNKAVDWLFYTGRLPTDPLGRLFSTVSYARKIVFSSQSEAHLVIDRMSSIHGEVEKNRGTSIPAWAYRDVLYMLIDYSIRSYELLERALSSEEKQEVFKVFKSVGERMKIPNLPFNYDDWLVDRQQHMEKDLVRSSYTDLLFVQYKKHLGFFRYQILLNSQATIVPEVVRNQLKMKRSFSMSALIIFYKQLAKIKLDWHLKKIILPAEYLQQVKALDD
jgi:uncharacterized protein (DUF2236 family)